MAIYKIVFLTSVVKIIESILSRLKDCSTTHRVPSMQVLQRKPPHKLPPSDEVVQFCTGWELIQNVLENDQRRIHFHWGYICGETRKKWCWCNNYKPITDFKHGGAGGAVVESAESGARELTQGVPQHFKTLASNIKKDGAVRFFTVAEIVGVNMRIGSSPTNLSISDQNTWWKCSLPASLPFMVGVDATKFKNWYRTRVFLQPNIFFGINLVFTSNRWWCRHIVIVAFGQVWNIFWENICDTVDVVHWRLVRLRSPHVWRGREASWSGR